MFLQKKENILLVSSFFKDKGTPDGAQIIINDMLKGATESTLNLTPGEYKIKIIKEGYFPWEKTVLIKQELVTNADVTLFPIAPKLESIATVGVEEPLADPSGTKIAFRVASQSAKKNGIYVLDMSSRPVLTLQSSSTQLVDDTINVFSQAHLSWSPDGQELLSSITGALTSFPTSYLLRSSGFNDSPRDVTAILQTVLTGWQQEQAEKDAARLTSLKPKLREMIKTDFDIVAWSPDETRILYTASRSAELPIIITPRRIGIDTMREVRKTQEKSVYVYDIKEDLNTKIANNMPNTCAATRHTCEPSIKWFPDSKHLIIVDQQKISLVEHDGTNTTTIYAGPFVPNYVFPWPNGSRLVILTNLNNLTIPPTLYTIGLK